MPVNNVSFRPTCGLFLSVFQCFMSKRASLAAKMRFRVIITRNKFEVVLFVFVTLYLLTCGDVEVNPGPNNKKKTSTATIMEYRCYYCKDSFKVLSETINHNSLNHPNEVLIYRKLSFNETTGKPFFKTKTFSLVPSEIAAKGERLMVNDTNDKITCESTSTHPGHSSNVNDHDDIKGGGASSSTKDELEELRNIIPDVAMKLKECGLLSEWLTFHKLVSEGVFPLDNIAFLLFVDVIRFYNSVNTSAMRYSKETKLFWKTGCTLFKGKFLRFMSGPKSQGDVIDGSSGPGECSSTSARINFAVPNHKYLANEEGHKEDIKPGVLHDCIDLLSDGSKQVKLAFDGKRINSAFTVAHGDVDLFGFEDAPTLNDRKDRKSKELATLESMITKAERHELTPLEIHSAVKMISVRIKELREMAAMKSEGVKKFKDLGLPDWRSSKYAYVISSLQSSLFQIEETIKSCLGINDRLCSICAHLQNAGNLFKTGQTLHLGHQENYICIQDNGREDSFEQIEINPEMDRFVLKQRSTAWFKIRKTAKVTGSTAHKALGLATLKDQTKYFNNLTGCVDQTENVPVALKEKFEHGIENEINALSTLVGKVLPTYYPSLCFVEEGCVMLKTKNKPFLVVSPDGSGRTDSQSDAVLAFEFKCPFGEKKYKPQVHYSLPEYYVLQVLCEMSAMQCKELLFLSYTDQSSTVLKVTYSQVLWEHIWDELNFLYGAEALKRPQKLREEAKTLKLELKDFITNNVEFVCEIPSIKGSACFHEVDTGDQTSLFEGHRDVHTERASGTEESIEQTLYKAKSMIEEAYELCRKRATELLVFTMSDLHRISNYGCGHSLPVAYGLQGTSIKMNTAREMLNDVLKSVDAKGLYPIVFSCDGQFINLVTRDFDDRPLTQLQHQKSFWEKIKRLQKPELLKFFQNLRVKDKVMRANGPGNVTFADVGWKSRHFKLLQTDTKPCTKTTTGNDDDIMSRIESILPINLEEKVDKDTYDEIFRVVKSLAEEKTPPKDDNQSQFDAHQNDDANLMTSTARCLSLRHEHLESMLSSLQSIENKQSREKWTTVYFADFENLFCPGGDINKAFTKEELKLCSRVIKQMFPDETKRLLLSSSKWEIIQELSKLFGLNSPEYQRKAKKVLALKDLAIKGAKNIPKVVLCALYAELTYPEKEEVWRQSFRYTSESVINEEQIKWFSYPASRINDCGVILPLLGVVDSHHILTNLRLKCCSSGIKGCALQREAWLKIAEHCRDNKTGLTLAHVDGLMDKQRNSYAQLTFSEAVETEMRHNGDIREADFCKLVRDWYRADDEPGMSSVERHQLRIRMRSWLMEKYCSVHFPPPSSYVRGIPIVTYEALMTNLERKMQLYSFVPSYNPRAVSTLDAENFFSVLGDMSPGGSGLAIRPADIPGAIKAACDMAKLYASSNRPFHLHTSRAPLYQRQEMMNVSPEKGASVQTSDRSASLFSDMSTILMSDHHFDDPSRRRRIGKRKSSSLSGPSQPAKGARGVRQFHKTDETKILPHIRLGVKLE